MSEDTKSIPDYSNVFIFVIASFSDPIYIDFIKMRKLQFKKYNIPNAFLFDNESECPSNYIKDENDYFFDKIKSPYPETPNTHLNPHMILKFIKALKMFDLSKYDYILRINLSTYINFNMLPNVLVTLPKHHLASGHFHEYFLNGWDEYKNNYLILIIGTFMILSYDTVQYLKTYDLNDRVLYKHNDDNVLSHLLHRYAWPFIYQPQLLFGDTEDYNYNIKIADKYCFIRIKHEVSSRKHDISVWINLLNRFDNINYIRQS